MAARKQRWHPDSIREKIAAAQLVSRLERHVKGDLELSATQVQAALGLLKKCVPDLAAVEHSGTMALTYEEALAALHEPDTASTRDAEGSSVELPPVRH